MKPSMPKDLKDKWLAALRSGEYKQCKSTLSDGVGYCCLGVLQMVADGQVEKETDAMAEMVPTNLWYVNHKVKNYYSRGFCLGDDSALAEMNDSGMSFKDIADVIEREVEGV